MDSKIGLVAIGGAGGAMGRHMINNRIEGRNSTSLINTTGSFALGYLIHKMTIKNKISSPMITIIGVGFLGAFTTFSTYSLELITLLKEDKKLDAIKYLIINAIGGPVMAYVGWEMAK
jgi:CrcB protein|tara:strand:+ start:1933 stop:2286 length:354 start_codon:yes stop_codon:yes gene_type:complete